MHQRPALKTWTECNLPAGGPSQGRQGQQPQSRKQKGSGQHANKAQTASFASQHNGSGQVPTQRSLPAALEQVTPPYDRLDGIVEAALPTHPQVIRGPLSSLLWPSLGSLQAFQRKQELR